MREASTKKILHITVGLDMGGAEQFLCRLIEAHKDNPEFSHSVISLTTKGVLSERLELIGVKVIPLGMKSIYDIALITIKTMRIMRTQNPDVIHCWMYYSDIVGGVSARLLGYNRIIWGIRNSHLEGGGSTLKRFVRTFCAFLSYFIPEKIACVAETARLVHTKAGYDKSKMVLTPNGFDINKFEKNIDERASIRNELGISESKIVIGSIGRYCKAKDHRNFIDAARLVLEKNKNIHFVMIGRDVNESNEEIITQINTLGIRNNFSLLGERQDIPSCLSAMDIFCLHSETEGFPNVLGEAMSTGLPCISTRAGDAEFIIGDCGTVVPPGSPVELAEAITSMSSLPPGDLRTLGNKSRERIEKNFTLERAIRNFEFLYCAA